jgi:elongation factor G
VQPRVAYRETITRKAEFNYTHKKQTGGSGQFGRVAGYMEPVEGEDFEFVNEVTGGSHSDPVYPCLRKGVQEACLAKGPKMEFPVTGIKVVINDGAFHSVDSSDMAFQAAARGAFLEGYGKAKPVIHEPIMKVAVKPHGIPGCLLWDPDEPAARDDPGIPGRGPHVCYRIPGSPVRDVRLFDSSCDP